MPVGILGIGLGWTNVKSYGAAGDGATDDTAAIAAAISQLPSSGGVLYFPPGDYVTTGGFTIAVPCTVLGAGGGYSDPAGWVTRVQCTSSSASLFTCSTSVNFRDLTLQCTSSTTPTAGNAITATGGIRFAYDRVHSWGFYDNIAINDASNYTITDCMFSNPVHDGLLISNTASPDSGDSSIMGCIFGEAEYDGGTAIGYLSSGGLKVVNCKVNGTVAHSFKYGLVAQFPTGVQTSILLISNCSFERCTTAGVGMSNVGTATFVDVVIAGCQFGSTPTAVTISALAAGNIKNVVVMGCVMAVTAGPAVFVGNVTGVVLADNIYSGTGTFATTTGSTSVTNVNNQAGG